MRQRFLVFGMSMLLVAACSGGGGATNGPGVSSGPGTTDGTGGSQAPAFDPSTVTGSVTLGQWQSSDAEKSALTAVLADFATVYPNITVEQELIEGDYRAEMVNRFGARSAPDIFYVNAEYAPEWMREGFLEPLDPWIEQQGFDTSAFFPDYLSIFQSDDQTFGLPKDGNTIAMAVNTDLVDTPPTTLEELVSTATALKGQGDLTAPMCLNPSLDRGLAFLYAEGGSLLSDDGTAATIDSAESKAAVQWYLDLFKDGLGAPAPANDWCGGVFGRGEAAIVFEGGWLKGAMDDQFPDVNWEFAEVPTGSSGSPVTINYTAAYGISPDSENKDAAWVLMQYLTGPEGMQKWTEGGIAVPSRSDVPTPAGFETIVAGAEYAKPGSGFMPGYPDVLKAFGDAFLKQVQDKTYSADPVVAATKAKIDEVLAE